MDNTIALLATAGLLAVGVPIHAQAKPDATAAAKGKVIYARYCASCHGKEARATAPSLPTSGSRLRT